MLEIIKSIIFGIIEGVTEWLPVSSTGHMILLDEFLKLNTSEDFMEMYLVVIQLGAILAVVLLFWNNLWPFCMPSSKEGKLRENGISKVLNIVKEDTFIMWFKIVVACIPAVIVELLCGDKLEETFYNYQTVSIMLIVVGIIFILIENRNKNHVAMVDSIAGITYQTAFLIGMFQLIAAVFPGTSRSGATIIGGLMLGLSRTIAAEFTFYLAVPVMFGASFIKIIKFGLAFSGAELAILLTGMITAFVVSVVVIKFLMGYIKKHDFKVFGWYRIVLGALVLLYFIIKG